MRRLWAIVGASLFLAVLVAGTADAGRVEDVMAAAMKDVEAGRCRQAVSRVEAIDGLTSRALLIGGQCLVGQGLYTEALNDFDRAERAGDLTGDEIGDLELYRGIALFHLERFGQANAALDRAEGTTRDDAQLALYRGMIALRQNDNDRAAPALESAARLSPARTEPVASYYAGLAWQGASERSKARAAFQRVIDLDPDGPWGKEAANLLESTELFPFFLRLSAGVEYDDNVLLRAQGTDRLSPDGDKDWRGVWNFEAGIQLFQKNAWAGGILASYSGTKHQKIGDFDANYPTIGVFLDRRFGPQTNARLRYSFGHAWIDKGAFLRTQTAQASLTHTWDRLGTTEILGDFTSNDFRFENVDVLNGTGPAGSACPPGATECGPPGLNEGHERDRDGYGLGAALEHRYRVPIADGLDEFIESLVLRGGYRFGWYNSQGTEWQRISNIVSLGFGLEVPFEVSFNGKVSFERYDYANPSTFPDRQITGRQYALASSDRKENAVYAEARLEKDLNEYFSVSARYSYYEIDSNRRVYSYRRHIVGAYVNFRFD